ncbi:MAG: hypothetical protein DLM58_19715, partial [Pseudonocardiales bacterium]
PLLILVGYSSNTNSDLFNNFQGSLPTLINDQFANLNHASGSGAYHLDKDGHRVAGAIVNYAPDRMWGAALTLIAIVLVLNIFARFISRFNKISS